MSPEFLLTAACCRSPLSEERAPAIRAAAQGIADWDRFLRVVQHHRVAMQVQQALSLAGIELPPAAASDIEILVKRRVHRGVKLAAQAVRLQNLLTAAGIPSIVLKGVALEQLAYGAVATKQTRDVDCLVLPEHAEAALALLEREGYTLSLPAVALSRMQRRALIRFGREVEVSAPRSNLRVDLQWRLADNPALLSGTDARAATQTVTLSEGASVRTLAPDDLFAYLCVHGAHHSWSRLKWLADLNALILSTNPDIERLYRHAQKIGAGLCAAQGLLLCQGLLNLQLPTRLAEELGGNKRHQKLVANALDALTTPNLGSVVGIWAVLRELRNQFLLGTGLPFYLSQCRLALVGVADIVRLPLPRPLHFIYPLVRVPLWLWRRAKLTLVPQ
jgi:hypothetical protein